MCSDQLSLLPTAGWETSSSLRATQWKPSVADWGNCLLALAMDGRIMHYGVVSSCQSAALFGL